MVCYFAYSLYRGVMVTCAGMYSIVRDASGEPSEESGATSPVTTYEPGENTRTGVPVPFPSALPAHIWVSEYSSPWASVLRASPPEQTAELG